MVKIDERAAVTESTPASARVAPVARHLFRLIYT
jgi:hypothetical protein